jgi:ribonucleoside-triphosphate reductase
MGYNILQKDGQEFVKKLLATVNDINDIQSSKYEVPMNCEQVPSEQSSIKIAQADKLLGYNKKYPFYSNQFIPLIVEADLIDRIKLQGMFDSSMSGGAICHLNFADKIAVDYMKKVISFAISQGVVYMAINYNLQSCKNNHITVGKGNRCEICGEKIVDNFTRVVGFVTSVNHWAEKRREFDYPNRQFYKKEEINLTPSQ